jgi:tRNA dimethylallyltransferase
MLAMFWIREILLDKYFLSVTPGLHFRHNHMKPSSLTFIVGPTASGKTALALEEAERSGAVILSCDSLCVYRGMDIGTAKPTLEEQYRVRHYGIDLAEPSASFSVARYIAYRDAILEELRGQDQRVLVVGGSGFYLKSFFAPVTDQIEIAPEIERIVLGIRERDGLDGLSRELRRLHSRAESFPGLDWNNPRRVEKALVRCLASGRTYTELLEAFENLPEPLSDWEKEVWMVSRSPESLQRRNALRVGSMLESGLVDEVRRLRASGFERNPSACGAIGYREVLDHLDGRVTLDELPELIVTHTQQLMRKQRTWFRKQIPIHREILLGEKAG